MAFLQGANGPQFLLWHEPQFADLLVVVYEAICLWKEAFAFDLGHLFFREKMVATLSEGSRLAAQV